MVQQIRGMDHAPAFVDVEAWDTLTPHEQTQMISSIVRRVDFDGGKGTLAIRFHPNEMQELAAQAQEEMV